LALLAWLKKVEAVVWHAPPDFTGAKHRRRQSGLRLDRLLNDLSAKVKAGTLGGEAFA